MGNPLPVDLPQECAKATKILNAFIDPVNGLDRIVPVSVLRKAKGFAIFSVFRIGFLMSARGGSGIVIAKTEDGEWSAPAAIGIGGLGGGFNVGAEVTDFLIVLNSRSAVKSFMATGSLQLGGNLSVAVGPVGRSAEASGSVNTKGQIAAMYSYSKSKGLYGGVSVEGTVLVDREDANAKAYGRQGHTAKRILSGSVEPPPFADTLIGTIEKFTLANTPSGDLDGRNGYGDYGFGRRDSQDDESLDSRDFETDNPRRNRTPSSFTRERRDAERDRRDADLSSFDRLNLDDDNPRRESEEWAEADRRRRDNAEARSMGTYAFGSPHSALTSAPPRTGSGGSFRSKRPGLRQRSSSIASNLSFGSFGKKKLDRSGPTPPPDWADNPEWDRKPKRDEFDELDRELQSIGAGSKSHSAKAPSYGGQRSGSSNSTKGYARPPSTELATTATGRQGWSTFQSSHDDDDLFGGGGSSKPATTGTERDPFANLTAGLEPKWTGSSQMQPKWESGYAGSTMRGTAPKSRGTPTIREDPTPVASAPTESAVVERVVALYDFEAQEEGDLGFTRGQVIAVTKRTDSTDDWWQGKVQVGATASKTGIFPANYTEPL